ncbi:hypothetical protein BGZ57DRAFT_1015936 [Hyaloscypha finlandica]|nr:hypothetical protein BGZ57DRAFT_1015936 [Hyaloscypha finlandica]
MWTQSVHLGATGVTGGSILNGSPESGEVTTFLRPSSVHKQYIPELVKGGVKILIADISSPIEQLVTLFKGVDVFISALSGMALLEQINVVTEAKGKGVKRFVSCGLATVCPAGGVNVVLRYPFIDVGYWYQFSFPHLPSGQIDDFTFPKMYSKMRGYVTALNLITDSRDIGDFVARIVGDERTLIKYDVHGIMEEVSGETLKRKTIINAAKTSAQEREEEVLEARKFFQKEPENREALGRVASAEYEFSKYVCMDNQAPRQFIEFVRDLMDGAVLRQYSGLQ